MTEVSFFPGQRWVSNTESELGLGIVIEASARRVELSFPAAEERRVYAADNAPLSRVEYQVGERVSAEGGSFFTIEEVTTANHCLIYGGVDENGGKCVVPEQSLNSQVQFSKPQDRLFAGQIDRNHAFQLRCETYEHSRLHQQSPVLGLLGPRVQLLPHQLYIAGEIANRYAPRVLLADEVGLGKTIEAGLIMHQQLVSGLARRVLIVVPDSLLHQWLVEMLRRFNLLFSIVDVVEDEREDDQDDESAGGRLAENPFESSQLILCTLSYLRDHPDRQRQAVEAGWDLLVVDEAQHLHWSAQKASAEYLCIEALAAKARGLLLLTATPEQLGLESHFARLRLLDPDRYYDLQAFIDEELKHQPVNVLVQRLLAPEVYAELQQGGLATELEGYLGQAAVAGLLEAQEKDDPETFKAALEGVIRALLDRHGTGRVLFRNTRASIGGFPERKLTRYPLDAPDNYRSAPGGASIRELLAPELLLGESWVTLDPRVQWLVDWLEQNRGEKALVICAHTATAMALEEHLSLRAGVLSAVFHEGLTLVARDRAAAWFADEESGAQVLICSEIGSEGRNFQFARHLVLFDLPLNPDLLEQRIGRLDRIGQRHAVEIHVPFFSNSAQSVLLRWYHDGLDAIEHTCPAGQALYEFFRVDLLHSLKNAEDSESLKSLLQQTWDKARETIAALQKGRDRLLELNSFNRQRADEIVGEMIRGERRKELSDYMERIFDQFGVEQEHHTSNSLVLKPGDHMPVHSFPALPEDGITATYQRDLALSREDLQFLTWEHPMVSGAMDLVLSGEFGNTAFCTLKLPPLRPGTILLETLYVFSCIAPGDLQLHRFLPLTTVRLLVDNRNNDLTGILSSAHLGRLVKEAPIHNARDLVRHTRPRITSMLAYAGKLAQAQEKTVLEGAVASMRSQQRVEWERMQALSEVNPNIRREELDYLEHTADRLEPYLRGARLRLDAIRVVMVAE